MEDYTASPALRAAAYWFIDGLPEIVSGLVMTLCGGIGLLLWSAGVSPLFAFLGLILLWKDRGAVEFLKARLTYPRTGYARPPMDSDDPTARTIATLMPPPVPASDKNVTHFRNNTVVPLVFLANFVFLSDRAWMWPVGACGFVAALYVLNRRLERPYRWWEALPLALAASALTLSNLPRNLRLPAALILIGAWLLALGGGKLAFYLRMHPRPSQEGARA